METQWCTHNVDELNNLARGFPMTIKRASDRGFVGLYPGPRLWAKHPGAYPGEPPVLPGPHPPVIQEGNDKNRDSHGRQLPCKHRVFDQFSHTKCLRRLKLPAKSHHIAGQQDTAINTSRAEFWVNVVGRTSDSHQRRQILRPFHFTNSIFMRGQTRPFHQPAAAATTAAFSQPLNARFFRNHTDPTGFESFADRHPSQNSPICRLRRKESTV